MSDRHAKLLAEAAADERSVERILSDQHEINQCADWDAATLLPDGRSPDAPEPAIRPVSDE